MPTPVPRGSCLLRCGLCLWQPGLLLIKVSSELSCSGREMEENMTNSPCCLVPGLGWEIKLHPPDPVPLTVASQRNPPLTAYLFAILPPTTAMPPQPFPLQVLLRKGFNFPGHCCQHCVALGNAMVLPWHLASRLGYRNA
jgi:hypothetical protein